MTDQDPAIEFMALYQSVYRNLHSTWNKTDHPPSTESIAVLNHLILSGPLTVAEAARHFKRGQSTMSELIDRLQANGYVDRIKDSRDKRRTLVWLTEKGREIYDRTQEVLDRKLLSESIEMLTVDERSVLLKSMRSLLSASREIVAKRRIRNE